MTSARDDRALVTDRAVERGIGDPSSAWFGIACAFDGAVSCVTQATAPTTCAAFVQQDGRVRVGTGPARVLFELTVWLRKVAT